MSPCFTSPNHWIPLGIWSTRWLLFQVMSNIPILWDIEQPLPKQTQPIEHGEHLDVGGASQGLLVARKQLDDP